MVYESLKRFVIGDPLASQHEKGERVSIPLALAVFAPDALSSTAYATQEILMALILSNVALQANEISIPIAFAILLLIIIVVSSYRQVIRAYPDGGGAYVVAKKCLGEKLSLVAGASLLIDYVLTAAVSLCAAVEEMTSFRLADGSQPIPVAHAVPMALAFLVLMVLLNLRGLKESGKVLVFPIYTFILSMYALIGYGCFQVFTGQLQIPVSPQFPPVHAGPASGFSFLTLAGIFIGLKAFSHGCSALTGIKAISNGVTAFKEPVVKNANRTMILMGIILGTTFLGLTYLALQLKILPLFDGEDKITSTVISLVNGTVFGAGSWPYMIV
ncbi:MAG: amino acid permease, partial [Cyanobacteria bacterium]|nr:amino acid permease [Cyanobacteriota bacterium]